MSTFNAATTTGAVAASPTVLCSTKYRISSSQMVCAESILVTSADGSTSSVCTNAFLVGLTWNGYPTITHVQNATCK